ncbi:MAG: hypothetical protein II047_03105 [Bacteroidales bacterium]|nr:hypothetical protein [Bacteroidales bacterium]
MRKINFKHSLWTVMAAVLIVLTLVSCGPHSRKHVSKNFSIEVNHPFPNTNWAFEEEVLDFSFDIEDTTTLFDISLLLLYDTAVNTLKDIPLTLTLSSPDGMKSICASHFLLDAQTNPDIKITSGSNAELNVVVYPKRKFKVPGTHTLTVYRRAEKADNYGFQSLSAMVKVAK